MEATIIEKSSHPYNDNYTSVQLMLPIDLQLIIPTTDPVYKFEMIMNKVNFHKYLVSTRTEKRGRRGYNPQTLLKIILFGFMLNGFTSLRELESACATDIRFMWMLRNEKSKPTHMTFSNFINKFLKKDIQLIFTDITHIIFQLDSVDLSHCYIDGTKIEANANKYTWVWKNSCITNRNKLFLKISELLNKMNDELKSFGTFYQTTFEYEIDELETILSNYQELFKIDPSIFTTGKGHRKSENQRNYELMKSYIHRLKDYAKKIDICGENRNSYSKTDTSATFMRIKKDYKGNDQLLPAYNLQYGICDQYIAVLDINQRASDMDCFIPLMEKFKDIHGIYPKYPVADAGYGSYNNYLYCFDHNMEKYMKFPMYKKWTENKKYREDMFKPVNFTFDKENRLLCPNKKIFNKIKDIPVKGNKYHRTEEVYQCENCEGCPFRNKCHQQKENRVIHINKELTAIHEEVISNLQGIQGCLLRTNRSIQSEGAFGILKEDKGYRRMKRKGMNSATTEAYLIAIGFNLKKYYNKTNKISNHIL